MYIQPQKSGCVDIQVTEQLQNSGPKGQRTANFAVNSSFPIPSHNGLNHPFCIAICFSIICKALCFDLNCSKVCMQLCTLHMERKNLPRSKICFSAFNLSLSIFCSPRTTSTEMFHTVNLIK